MSNKYPVILVHGILGFGPKELGRLNYWGSALRVPSSVERHEASVGPLSSAHDAACELAAQIKGTKVNYGVQHANDEQHNRYGYDFTHNGFVKDWSEDNPVHLVGHSLGSQTIRCLQHLLEEDYWGWGSNHKWVSSISTVSGVLNGSTLVYFFEADEKTGILKKNSFATPLMRMIEIFCSATGGFLDSIYNFDLDHWGFVRPKGESLSAYLDRVAKSNFLWGKDNAAYTLSLQGAYADNAAWKTFSDTYYFSYVTEQTGKILFSENYYPDLLMNPALLALSIYIGCKNFDTPPIPVMNFSSSDWWENDGAVSTYSQMYPRTNGSHPVGLEFDGNTPVNHLTRGVWHYKWEKNVDHLDICILPQKGQIDWQRRFYQGLFNRLAAL